MFLLRLYQLVLVYGWLPLVIESATGQLNPSSDKKMRTQQKPTESVLIEDLTNWMTTSGKVSRPVAAASSTVRVNYSISVVQIQELDQKKQKMTIHLWKEMRWRDEYLVWDPEQYDGIKSLRLSHTAIWTPDIVLYNTYENRKSDDHDVQAQVNHDGMVAWMPPVIYHSSCLVDLANFPFDTQTCRLEFGSWTYNIRELDLVLNKGNHISMDSFIKNVEWELIHYNVTRDERMFDCCPDAYVIVTYTFVLRRNAGYYTRVMLMPVLLLSTAAGFIFCIPAQRPDRTVLGLSLFTSFMLLLLLVVDISPPSAESKLSTYLSVYVCLVTSAIMLSILLINLSTWKDEMPRCFKTYILRPMDRLLRPFAHVRAGKYVSYCVRKPQDDNESDNTDPALCPSGGSPCGGSTARQPERQPPGVTDWVLLVTLIDRLLFIIYVICLVVCVMHYFPWPEE